MFTRARIKLTGFYLLILVIVVGIFSGFLYHYTVGHLRQNVEIAALSKAQHKEIESTIDDIQATLFTGDAVVLVLAGILAYFLAGKTLRPIQDAHDAQAQFSAHASHELRTPLSVMKTENEVFLNSKDFNLGEARTLAESNLEEIDRMSEMVENLLILARNSKVDSTKNFIKVDIAEVLAKSVESQHHSAKAKSLILSSGGSKNMFVLGNKKLLEQVFDNIIQNAITYTQAGSIKVETRKDAGSVSISVRDTGIGIAPENVSHLTEAFYKADSSRTVDSSGVGLGLSIADRIIHMHKGRLHITSELGKGTIVTVTLLLA